MPTTERINFQTTSVLSSGLCGVSRLPGAAISPGNYGSFEDPDQLVIPSSNVGTILTFPHVIKDYLYIDVEIVGGVAGVTIFSPFYSFGFVGGIKNVTDGRYTIRLPYVGAVYQLLFELKDYRVKSITVGYTTDNVVETIDDVNWLISPSVDWTSSTGQVAANVAPGATVKGTLVPNLPSGYRGKIYIQTYKPLYGLTTVIPGVTVFDGKSCFSNFTFNPFVLIFDANPDNCFVQFTNTLDENVVLTIFTRVLNFKDLSTVYGNN